MAHYLGIDGGGSKTTCIVGDESTILATVTAGPSNITRVGETRARESLHEAIVSACGRGKIIASEIKHACIGVAGAGRPEIAGTVRQIVGEVISSEIKVVGDMEIAMSAAFGDGPGVIVIAGTGSIAYGRNAQGKTARAGGWGFAVSDEGSAHWIGRTSVAAVLRAIDEAGDDGKDAQSRAESLPLFRKLKSAWNLHSLEEFVCFANSTTDFAALFPAMDAGAQAGDELAMYVLAQAGRELASLADTVIRRLAVEGDRKVSLVYLAMAGGVFRHSSPVRDTFIEEVRKTDVNVEINPQIIDPVIGALKMARAAGRRK